jgi:hypothetical protein
LRGPWTAAGRPCRTRWPGPPPSAWWHVCRPEAARHALEPGFHGEDRRHPGFRAPAPPSGSVQQAPCTKSGHPGCWSGRLLFAARYAPSGCGRRLRHGHFRAALAGESMLVSRPGLSPRPAQNRALPMAPCGDSIDRRVSQGGGVALRSHDFRRAGAAPASRRLPASPMTSKSSGKRFSQADHADQHPGSGRPTFVIRLRGGPDALAMPERLPCRARQLAKFGHGRRPLLGQPGAKSRSAI